MKTSQYGVDQSQPTNLFTFEQGHAGTGLTGSGCPTHPMDVGLDMG